MVELPDDVAPNGAAVALLDFGMTLRSSTGAGSLRTNRKGSRWRASISLPPMRIDKARRVIARLVRAKREGLRIPFPLLESQGIPGNPTVDGSAASGHTLPVKGLTANYAVREGYWLSIEDSAGQHYLHNVVATVVAASNGKAVLPIEPELRYPPANGDKIHLVKPMIEGFVQGEEWGWALPVDRLIRIEFPIEEAD